MLTLYWKLRSLTTRQEGQGMVEYALILVLVSIVVIVRQSIPLRHQIPAADLETAKISLNGNGSLTNTYTSPTDVLNLISEINISKGAVITSDMLARDINLVPAGNSPAYLPLASG